VEEAKVQDQKTLEVWKAHAGHHVIHNKERDFEAKMVATVQAMCQQLQL